MQQYTTDKPSFSESISIPQITDTNSADNINASTKQLLENTLVNAEKIRGLGGSGGSGIVGAYRGVDLTVEFADEIANFSSPWAWIKDRICHYDGTLEDYVPNTKGLNVCDYIPLEINGNMMDMQIAGFDTHPEANGDVPAPHVDFISRDLYPTPSIWANGEDNNSNDERKRSPFCSSRISTVLEELYNDLPEELKESIIEKYDITETRYSEDPLHPLIDSTGRTYTSMGHLWLPSEFEVCGAVIHGSQRWSAGRAMQYPIFSGNIQNRNKGVKDFHDARGLNWWLSTPCSRSLRDVSCMYSNVFPRRMPSVYQEYFPICFRIGITEESDQD